MLWSIGNELSSQPGPVQIAYINAAVKFAKEMDPTRPVGLAVAAYPSSLCQAAQYKSLDVLGLNDYFGWYPGPSGQIFDRTKLSGYLDAVRACYPDKAIMISEFGAEANRDGPVEEKGTWAFQQDWINYQLGVFATKPWLSGAIYWALNEFWVRPGWDGGNPRPISPIHQKGLITYDGVRKPAWADVQRSYTTTQQLISRLPGGNPAAHGGGLDRLARPHAAAARVGELVVPGAQPPVGLNRAGQRDPARRGGLRLVADAVVAAAAGIVLIVGRPVRRAVGTKEHQEERAAEHERHEVENAEDHEQLRVGGHCSMNTQPGACPDAMFATMLGRSSRRFPLPAATLKIMADSTKLSLNARDPEGSRTARRLRRTGQVPGVIYGEGGDPSHFSVDARILRNTLAHSGAILDVSSAATPPSRCWSRTSSATRCVVRSSTWTSSA